jgi:hypothetical protein
MSGPAAGALRPPLPCGAATAAALARAVATPSTVRGAGGTQPTMRTSSRATPLGIDYVTVTHGCPEGV